MTTTSRERFRPTVRATAIALPAFLILIGLGTWQLYRLDWKTGLIAFREAQLAAPPAPLPADPTPAEVDALEFRRVTVEGVFRHDRELYLAATREGRFGFDVITPLARPGGETVLVDRGWVPDEARPPERRAAGQVAGPVKITGVVRRGAEPGLFTPENDPADNYWFWLDPPAMAAAAGVDAPPLVVVAGPEPNPGGLPVGRELRVGLENRHLEYALTWYALALALAVIYVLSQRRPEGG